MKSKRIPAILLALAMLGTSLGGCSEKPAEEEGGSVSAENTSSVTDTQQTEEEDDDGTSHYYEDLAAEDFGGWTVNIANDPLSTEYFSGFCVEELTGDAFTDGLYNRQIAIQDKYNVVLEESNNGSSSTIRQSVTSGSGDVAFGYVLTAQCMGLISSNFVLPVSELPD